MPVMRSETGESFITVHTQPMPYEHDISNFKISEAMAQKIQNEPELEEDSMALLAMLDKDFENAKRSNLPDGTPSQQGKVFNRASQQYTTYMIERTDGVRDGLDVEFYANGEPKAERNWEKGKPTGGRHWDKDGNLFDSTVNEGGVLRERRLTNVDTSMSEVAKAKRPTVFAP